MITIQIHKKVWKQNYLFTYGPTHFTKSEKATFKKLRINYNLKPQNEKLLMRQ